ncbi:MAG: gluconate kinase [Flammeovirgaceae bacterium]|nr:gluconate kinase [Flammeovirgaceae bacterium]
MKQPMKIPKVLVLMGVTCSGKTELGKILSVRLKVPFFDGDDFHSKDNIHKMKQGIPLNDGDRQTWLQYIHGLASNHSNKGAIIACSALKEKYRQVIQTSVNVEFIYLKADKRVIAQRLASRKNHFMHNSLIDSQFTALEEPKNGCIVDATQSFEINVDLIVSYLQNNL